MLGNYANILAISVGILAGGLTFMHPSPEAFILQVHRQNNGKTIYGADP